MHDLVAAIGRNHGLLRAFLEPHHHLDLGAERLTVEIERLLAAAVEKQVWLNQHDLSSLGAR